MNPLPVFLYVEGNQLVIEIAILEPALPKIRLHLPPRPPGTNVVQIGELVMPERGRFKGRMYVTPDGNSHLDIESVQRIPDWVPGMEWVVP